MPSPREPIAEEIDDQRLAPEVLESEPAEALSQPGVRRRIRLRRYLITSDAMAAAAIGFLALAMGFPTESVFVLLLGISFIVRHDRERRIGEFWRRPTLPFNGYADQVASLYEGMDLKKFY